LAGKAALTALTVMLNSLDRQGLLVESKPPNPETRFAVVRHPDNRFDVFDPTDDCGRNGFVGPRCDTCPRCQLNALYALGHVVTYVVAKDPQEAAQKAAETLNEHNRQPIPYGLTNYEYE
jgi:hypothetical protein